MLNKVIEYIKVAIKNTILFLFPFFMFLSHGSHKPTDSHDKDNHDNDENKHHNVTPDQEHSHKEDESHPVITMATSGQNGEIAQLYILKLILQDHGYESQVVIMPSDVIIMALSEGEIDMTIACPSTNSNILLNKTRHSIKILPAFFTGVRTGIVVPNYVNVYSLLELKGLGKMFDNKIHGIMSGSGIMNETSKMIKSLNLENEYELQHHRNTSKFIEDISKMIDNEQPFLSTLWRPHSLFKRHHLRFLYDDEDNQHFKTHHRMRIVLKKKVEHLPSFAYNLFKNYKLSNADYNELIKMEIQGYNPTQIAYKWIENNQNTIILWLKGDVKQSK